MGKKTLPITLLSRKSPVQLHKAALWSCSGLGRTQNCHHVFRSALQIRALAPGRRGSLAQQDVGSWTAAFQQVPAPSP